jgi:hypothetical protein
MKRYADSSLPGISTFVSDKSKLDLPTDIDREKESVLPPGSAHPGAGGRDIRQRFEFNVPDNDIDKRPRTKGKDGEEYGNPYKDDTAGVTRRTMTATLPKAAFMGVVARVVEAYERRRGRTRRQRGRARTKSRQYYTRNRTKIKLRNRAWRRKNRNNPQHKANVRHYRKNPSMHRRLAFETTTTQPTFQHRQNPSQKRKDNRYYKSKRKMKLKKSLRRYNTFCVHNSKCQTQRENQREHPKRFKRRPQLTHEKKLELRREREQEKRDAEKKASESLMVGQSIGFSLAPDMDAAYVNSINPETGEVTFTYEVDDDTEPPEQDVLPLPVFLEAAVFYDDEGEDAFFNMIDAALGEEAYDELDEATVQACAVLFDHDPDAPEFKSRCRRLLDEGELAKADPGALRNVLDLIVKSPHGEDVLHTISRVAHRKQAGDLILYDKENPKQETEQPGANTQYSAVGPGTYQRKPDEKEGVPSGSQMPDTHTDNVPAGSSRVVPNGEGQMWSGDATYLQASLRSLPSERQKVAATISQLLSATAPDVVQRGGRIKPALKRADPAKGMWTFTVSGSKGEAYTVRVKALPANKTVKTVEKSQVQVSCSCDFFRWQGPEHWAKVEKYLYGKPVGTASKPVVKDPDSRHRVCKHLVGVFGLARKYRVASGNTLWWPADADVTFAPYTGE